MKGSLAAKRWIRHHQRLTLVAILAVFTISLGLLFYGSLSSGPVKIEAGVLTPPPSFSGENSPNVFFTINYTGIGFGNYTYMISYNTTGGGTYTNFENILVRTGSPFTYYLYVPSQSGSISVVHVDVYRGNSRAAPELIFQKTLTV